MRKVTMYYAYDDKEFDNYNACLEYENKGYGLMRSIEKKYSFYDKNMKEMIAPLESPNVEDWLTWLDDACSNCTYIKRHDILTAREAAIIDENLGCCILNYDFNGDTGLFKYDERTGKWDKVDE